MEEYGVVQNRKGYFSRMFGWVGRLPKRIATKMVEFVRRAKKIGQEDPRRVIHSLKVGLAITLVSLFYYFDTLYEGFGVSAMWAVLTVVVVFEFYEQHLEEVSIGARYDYGLLIFILTFCLISVSGYRDEEVLEMALKRVSTILIGGLAALLVCVFIYPAWADFGDEFFRSSREGESNKATLEGYKSVLNSKNTEESLANFARWEPRHGQFRYRHPWKQYLKVGSLTRQCAYRIEALNGYLSSDIQVGPEIKSKIEEACTKMSSESGKALNELAFSIKSMTPPSSASIHIGRSKQAARTLESLLNSSLFKDMNILEVVPVASVASLLIDVVSCTEEIAESVDRLASLARFKSLESKTEEQKKPEDVCDNQALLQKCATIGSHHLRHNMEYAVGQSRKGCFSRMCGWIRCLPKRLSSKMAEFVRKAKKLGEEDPRRVVHSLKVGLAITLVSQIYYLDTLYEGFGDAAMWAVLTVVVVLEFSVGATLGRGLNRGLATFLAGTLGFGAHHVASLFGEKLQPILLGLFARYDYGLLVFILTFCLISVSGYRDEEVLDMALNRISTILIGGFVALFVCIFLYPVWADFGDEFFQSSREGESNKASLEGYKSVLNSKNTEEALANFARWEPGHGQFRYRHPWKQYLKIGSLTRQCAYRIEALNGYLSSDIQEACTKMSSESGKALTEIAFAIKSMSPPFTASIHIVRSKQAATTLESLLNSSLFRDMNILEVVPVASVASLLTDVVSCTEELAESVHRLASLARFKCLEPKTAEQKKPEFCDDQAPLQKCATIGSHIIIDHRAVKPTTRKEMASANQANEGAAVRGCLWLLALVNHGRTEVVELARKTKELGKEDPRRIVHSLKVGLAITLVSVFYYFKPLYDGFGVNAIWAVLTVSHSNSGSRCSRYRSPSVSNTFSCNNDIYKILSCAEGKAINNPHRLWYCTSGVCCHLSCMDRAGTSQPCSRQHGKTWELLRSEYFKISEDVPSSSDKSCLRDHASVLSSKTSEENMANLARWEPGHGRFLFFHPWQQYLKIGALSRECAYKLEALNNYLTSEIQTSKGIKDRYQESCTKISTECGKALKELASATKRMERSKAAEAHIARSKDAAENVTFLLRMPLWEGAILLDMVPVVAVASLLLQVVEITVKVAEAVHDLASMAHFKNMDPTALQEQTHCRGLVQPTLSIDMQIQVISGVEKKLPKV
ncbi:hypothetical protein Tsubulata_028190, partial [Turnera subulata]